MIDNAAGSTDQLKVVYSFFGPPGTGKGTVAREAVRTLGFSMVSTGEMLRAEVASGSDLGLFIQQTVSRGGLVSDDIVAKIVFNALSNSVGSVFILDGYPRNESQAEDFLNEFSKKFPSVVFKVVYFSLSSDEIRRRLSARLICQNKRCQQTYSQLIHHLRREGFCDACDSALMRRSDDAGDIVLERLGEYEKHANGVLDVYLRRGVEICELDLFGKSESAVFSQFVSQCGI
ncbi:adenylate kinase [Candidatus Dependentiae bacterium]|nr:adenylate kinase [Candidatus Dependentiae bacterium]